MHSVIQKLATANDTTVTKFLDSTFSMFLDQSSNDITVTKFLEGVNPALYKQLEVVEDDIAITKYLASTNDITVTKFLAQAADDIAVTKFLNTSNDITVTKFLEQA